MKKGLIAIVVVLIIITIFLIPTYNSLVNLEETVNSSWAQVENQLKRRADLIPNLVSTVKGYAGHEKEVLTEITNARSKINEANTPQEYAEADQEMNKALSNLNVVVENYPELKANENFKSLQIQIEGTENRISTERMRYNDSVEKYNIKLRRFPTNILANIFGFNRKEYFKINDEESKVPEVNF